MEKIIKIILKIIKKVVFIIWCVVLFLLMTGLITPEWKFALILIFIYLIFTSFSIMILKKRRKNKRSDENERLSNNEQGFVEIRRRFFRRLENRDENLIENTIVSNVNVKYDSMSGEEFEVYVSKILSKMGFCNIGLTKGSGDQGVDILAEKDRIKYAIQCKRYSSPVGNKAVQEVFAGVSFYHCHIGVVVTNNYFTNAAKELAYENGVVLWDKDFLDKYAMLIENKNHKESKSSCEMLNAEEKIMAIKNNKAGKVLYQYLLSSSRSAVDIYLKDGDGTNNTEDMIRCIEKPFQLYNSIFDSLEKIIRFTFYCDISKEFKKTSYYKELVKHSERNDSKYKDDLFEIQVIYNMEDIVLEKGRIKIEYRPNIKMFTTTMDAIKSSENIDGEKEVIKLENKTYYKGNVTENFFPMKMSNIRNK